MEYGVEFALTMASLNLSFGGSDKGKYGCESMDVMDDEVVVLVAVTFKHPPATVVVSMLEVVSCRDCCCCSSKPTVGKDSLLKLKNQDKRRWIIGYENMLSDFFCNNDAKRFM
ncbi:hypothetical protein X798_03399 [Onchocerca flexuosa]|uniref:Uncharacterized protein n=1 Tax=Onchocerca flexuosa TaxID=387005 RepID=A0A238BVV7_9BILA|nr:hypothetical protein X798_03399 [Onchocerca flexuosa]